MMGRNLKILLAAILIAAIFTQDRICEHFGFGQAKYHEGVNSAKHTNVGSEATIRSVQKMDDIIPEARYKWDEQAKDWVISKESNTGHAKLVNHTIEDYSSNAPIEIEWNDLMDIDYELRYFEAMEMEMYAPVFTNTIKALHEKEVIIRGYVLPFDTKGEVLALSYNPYANCFFCGKASPASVISLYLKDKKDGKKYKMDDVRTFKGTLYLNTDDPNEFYYILRDAEEV